MWVCARVCVCMSVRVSIGRSFDDWAFLNDDFMRVYNDFGYQ